MLVESDALGRYLYGHDLCVFVGERAHGQSRDDYKNSKQKIGGQTTNYKLHIIGTGSKFAQAKKLAANNPNIIFHGYQPAAEFLAQADHIIVPSLCYENSPTVIFESLSAGVPVIASNLGGISELIQNKINGY